MAVKSKFLIKYKTKITCLLFACLFIIITTSKAQNNYGFGNDKNDKEKVLEKYKKELFDTYEYDQFLEEQRQAAEDSLNVEQKLLLSPAQLKKLGVSDEVIKQITGLQFQKDSLVKIQETYDKLKKKELGIEDSVSLKDVEALIELQQKMLIKKALSLPEESVYGQSFFRRSMLKLFDEEVKTRVPENYTLSVGDELSIAIWGDTDRSSSYVIDEQGGISPKLVGRINLRGLSFKEAKEIIKQKYSRNFDLNKSKLSVTLNYSRVLNVNIVGELFNPGTYTFPGINSVYNALVAIDGPNDMGSVRSIFVKRNGETIKTFDLYKYLTNPDSKQDFFLEENDYVVVPALKNLVAIEGEVKRPFTYEMIAGETLLDLLDYAGGLKPLAHTKAIAVKRVENSEEVLLTVDYNDLKEKKTQFEVEDGDSVFIYKLPEILRNYVQVEGAVKIPGRYQLRKGERIADLLFRADGVLNEAYTDRAYVFSRDENLKKKVSTFNVKEVLKDPASSQNILLNDLDTIQILNKENFKQNFHVNISGAVHVPDKYVFAEGLTLKDLLFYAGGLKEEAANNRIEISRVLNFQDDPGQFSLKKGINASRVVISKIEISNDLSLPDGSEKFVLKPYDHVFVRTSPNFELQQNVKIHGEVIYPGEYSLVNKNERITSLIRRAGGLTEYAFEEGASLYRSEDSLGRVILELHKIGTGRNEADLLRYDYILTNGDSIFIPKIKDFVTISGAINFPGIDTLKQINVPWERGKNAKYYINKYAASFDDGARKSSTLVTQANGAVIKTQNYLVFKQYPEVEKGGSIFVDLKERKKPGYRKRRANRQPFNFEAVTAAAIPVLTLVILLQQALSKQ